MMDDVRTVVWKEWRSLFRQPGSRLRVVMTVAIPVAFFGVVGPLQAGEDFLVRADPWFVATAVPVLTVVLVAPDSFAGERERRTLRTLLASRLSDATILWSKVCFAVLLAMGLTVATMVLAHVVANVAADVDGIVVVAPGRLAHMLAVSVLLSTLAAAAAVLVSLRARTVQQAQQTLAAVFFAVPTILGPVLLLLSEDGEASVIADLVERLGTTAGRLGILAVLAALTAAVLTVARTSFRRGRLSS